MGCLVCGGGDRWSKTCRWRGEDKQTFAVCDPCYLVYRDGLLIVPGPTSVTGRCDACLEFVNPRELVGATTYAREVYRGVCVDCSEKGG